MTFKSRGIAGAVMAVVLCMFAAIFAAINATNHRWVLTAVDCVSFAVSCFALAINLEIVRRADVLDDPVRRRDPFRRRGF
jgi:hypothetical protein